jgi:hypothetical protein
LKSSTFVIYCAVWASPEGDGNPVYEDNTGCIEWGNHMIGGRERAKHTGIRKHFAHEVNQNRQMRIRVSTSDQLADFFKGVTFSALRTMRGRTHERFCAEGTLSLRRGAG